MCHWDSETLFLSLTAETFWRKGAFCDVIKYQKWGKGTCLNVWYPYSIQLTITFPGIGSTLLEQSHLPSENTAHTSYKYARQLEPLTHNFSSTRYPLIFGMQRQYGLRSLFGTSTHAQQWKSNPKPLVLISSPMLYPLCHMPFRIQQKLNQTKTRCHWYSLFLPSCRDIPEEE